MTRAEMLTELREVLDDTGFDGLWSDARLLAYLAEGQDVFCERTGYFRDFTNFSITLETGVASYAVPDRVIEILDIWDGTRRLGKFQEGDRGYLSPDWDPQETLPRTGDPLAWQTDRETGTITFERSPSAAENGDIFTLRVWRYSRFDLAGNGAVPDEGETPTAEPEIPSQFHRAPIEWAAYKAMTTHDAEKQDKLKAREHLGNFDYYVGRGVTLFNRYHGREVRVGTAPAYRT